MQKKLEHFFTVKHSQTIKRCFIYDPKEKRAFFAFEPASTDHLKTIMQDIKLYLRTSPQIERCSLPRIEHSCPTPLLISNLQKAVRRQDTAVALASTLALLEQDPLKLLRRLPIICIEDVAAIDSIPVMVWWMMAAHTLTHDDKWIILCMVQTLCQINEACPTDRKTPPLPMSHESLQSSDLHLSLYYRSQYGGMKGDMVMLQNAISAELPVHPTQWEIPTLPTELEVLAEAIDFHPFPPLLTQLQKRTGLEQDIIQSCIWFAESGVNVRKPLTLQQSEEYQQKPEWKKIESHLDSLRESLV
jgi:hypothetical protein